MGELKAETKHLKPDEPGDRLHNPLDGAQAALGRRTLIAINPTFQKMAGS